LKFREVVEEIVFAKTQQDKDKYYGILATFPFWMNPKGK
jgi:hypothetical protein